MSRIRLTNLSFHYDDPYEQVFERLSLGVEHTWRTGLIGRNGSGKSTLLALIHGTLTPHGGEVRTAGVTMRFPYTPPVEAVTTREVVRDSVGPYRRLENEMEMLSTREDEESVARFGQVLDAYERLGGYDIESRIERELASLGLCESHLDRPFATLSGGEQTRALIVPLFLRPDTFPLIDEPTNHLDIEGRRMLGEYLARQRGFIVVSHDRELLDACVDHIIAIDAAEVRVYQTSYTGWREQKEITELYEHRRFENLTREVNAMERAARERRQWSHTKEAEKRGAYDKGHIGARAARHMKRALHIERRSREALEEKRALLLDVEKERKLLLRSVRSGPDALLRVQDVSVSLGGREILHDVSLTVARGERVAILGPNGCGKTTLLRAITGEIALTSGIVDLPGHIRVVRAHQEPLWQQGPLREHLLDAGIDEQGFRRVMGSLGVTGEVFDRPLETFSLGQRKKVDLCRSFMAPAHLFIWDEPMNDIDVISREAIEAAVLAHEPTMLFVEHDRRFIRNVATRVISLAGGSASSADH